MSCLWTRYQLCRFEDHRSGCFPRNHTQKGTWQQSSLLQDILQRPKAPFIFFRLGKNTSIPHNLMISTMKFSTNWSTSSVFFHTSSCGRFSFWEFFSSPQPQMPSQYCNSNWYSQPVMSTANLLFTQSACLNLSHILAIFISLFSFQQYCWRSGLLVW
jgi:hypothetical protein